MDLDNPWYIQYFEYLGGILKGDLGESMRTHAPVADEIWPYLAATFELAFFAIIIAIVIGINAGIISAWFQNSWFDYTAMVLALIGVSMPIFWLRSNGAMVIFGLELGWFPTSVGCKYEIQIAAITNLYVIDTIIAWSI